MTFNLIIFEKFKDSNFSSVYSTKDVAVFTVIFSWFLILNMVYENKKNGVINVKNEKSKPVNFQKNKTIP